MISCGTFVVMIYTKKRFVETIHQPRLPGSGTTLIAEWMFVGVENLM